MTDDPDIRSAIPDHGSQRSFDIGILVGNDDRLQGVACRKGIVGAEIDILRVIDLQLTAGIRISTASRIKVAVLIRCFISVSSS